MTAYDKFDLELTLHTESNFLIYLFVPRLIEALGKIYLHLRPDSDRTMIRGGFLSKEDRTRLIALARDCVAGDALGQRDGVVGQRLELSAGGRRLVIE